MKWQVWHYVLPWWLWAAPLTGLGDDLGWDSHWTALPLLASTLNTHKSTVTLQRQITEKALLLRAGASWIRRKSGWAASPRHTQSPAWLLCSCVTWDPPLGREGLQASRSFLSPGFQASLFAQSKSIEVSLAFLVTPDRTSKGCSGCSRPQCSPGPWRGNAVPASSPGMGPVRLQHKARPLAEPFETEMVAWAGRVSVWGSFFSYCQEFPLPMAFIFPRNSLQLKEKRKSKQKTPSLNRETFLCESLIRKTFCQLWHPVLATPLPGKALGASLGVIKGSGAGWPQSGCYKVSGRWTFGTQGHEFKLLANCAKLPTWERFTSLSFFHAHFFFLNFLFFQMQSAYNVILISGV